MIKKLLGYGLIESVAKALNYLVLFLMPIFLNPKEFGKVGILVALEALFTSIFLFGQDRIILRYFHHEGDKGTFLYTVLVGWFKLTSLLLLLLFVVIYLFNINNIFSLKFFPDFTLLLIIIILSSFRLLYLAYLRINSELKLFFYDKIFFQTIKLILVLFLAYYLQNYYSYILGVFLIILIIFSFEIHHTTKIIKKTYDKVIELRNYKIGLPFVLHVIAGNLLIYISRFILEAFTNLENVGIYTFASNIGMGITFIYSALIVYFEPLIYKISNEDSSKTEEVIFILNAISIIITIIIVNMLVFFTPLFVDLIFLKHYSAAISIVPIVLGAMSFNILYLQSSIRLTLLEKTKFIPFSTSIATIINIVLLLFLVPKFHYLGAAYATFIGYAILAILTFTFSYLFSKEKLKYNNYQLLLSFISTLFLLSKETWIIYLLFSLVVIAFIVPKLRYYYNKLNYS